MMALRHRDASGGRWNGKAGADCVAGQGQMVDVALYESVFNLMESLVPEYDVAGVVRERTGGALPGIVPSNTYTTRDGQNVVIAGNGVAIFNRQMRAIRSEEHTSELQALIRTSYAVFSLKQIKIDALPSHSPYHYHTSI